MYVNIELYLLAASVMTIVPKSVRVPATFELFVVV